MEHGNDQVRNAGALRSFVGAVTFAAIVAAHPSLAVVSVEGHEAYTRQVEQMTGQLTEEQGDVVGQDSAVAVPFGEEVRFFFGDTYTTTSVLPNSMATTTDLDASDGIDLIYHSASVALVVLPTQPPEASV